MYSDFSPCRNSPETTNLYLTLAFNIPFTPKKVKIGFKDNMLVRYSLRPDPYGILSFNSQRFCHLRKYCREPSEMSSEVSRKTLNFYESTPSLIIVFMGHPYNILLKTPVPPV